MEQRKIGQVEIKTTQEEFRYFEDFFLNPLIEKWGDGSYFFVTDAHSFQKCPFQLSDIVKMKTRQLQQGLLFNPESDKV